MNRMEKVRLDDGPTDDTEAVALRAAGDDPAAQSVPRPGQPRQGEQLNVAPRGRNELVAVMDADMHLHREALNASSRGWCAPARRSERRCAACHEP